MVDRCLTCVQQSGQIVAYYMLKFDELIEGSFTGLKHILLIILGIIAIIVLLVILELRKFQRDLKEVNPEYVINFIKEKANDGSVSLSINYNSDSWVEVNANKRFPLASTVKIIVLIEYARQAAEGQIVPQKTVKLKVLDKLYIPNTDGGAHETWITQLGKQNDLDSVSLSEVANGMITYSSNACTDYLIDYLGIQNVNNVPKDLGISNHDPLSPVVGSLFIPAQLMHEKGLNKKKLLEEINSMDMEEYRERAIDIHKKLMKRSPTTKEIKQFKKVFNINIQRNWSNRLAGSTTKDYISILDKLNSKIYFNKDIHKHLDPIMEKSMKDSDNLEWFVHAGKKGGSTPFVLNMAMYVTDKYRNKTEFAFFSNDLSHLERAKLNRNLNAFFLRFLKDMEFRKRVKKEFSTL